MTVSERSVPGFLPSTAGFHFANRWPPGPVLRFGLRAGGPVPVSVGLTIGDAANGLCGGMALAALDRWLRAEPAPPDRVPPAPGTPLFEEIVRRQVESLERGRAVARFYRASAASPRARASIAVREAWPAIRADVDHGRPALLGLIHVASADPRRLSANHQVVVYGYELDRAARTVRLSIYDPNRPDDDTVRLRLTLEAADRVRYDYVADEAEVIGLVRLRGRPNPG